MFRIDAVVMVAVDSVTDVKTSRVRVEPDARNTVTDFSVVSTGRQVDDASPPVDEPVFRLNVE